MLIDHPLDPVHGKVDARYALSVTENSGNGYHNISGIEIQIGIHHHKGAVSFHRLRVPGSLRRLVPLPPGAIHIFPADISVDPRCFRE